MRPVRHSFVTFAFLASVVLAPLDGALAGDAVPREAQGQPPPADAELPAPDASQAAPVEPAGGQAEAHGPARGAGGEVVPASAAATNARQVKPAPLARPRRPAAPAPAQPAARTPPVPAAEPVPARGARVALPLEVEVHGRIYMGVAADERDDWTRRLDMDSARIGIEARLPSVRIVLEADLAERTPIEDAFARFDGPKATRLQVGRFKAPFSARQLESSWKLPLIDRGLVHEYLVQDADLGGRRLGAIAGVRPWGARVEAFAGVFAGERSAFGGESRAQDVAGRISARPRKEIELGATAYRAGSVDSLVPAQYAASLYAEVRSGPLEASVEGFAGEVVAGELVAGTALVGWTFAVGETRRLRVTPIAGAETLELRGTTRGVAHAAIAGAVLSWTEGLKVKLQGERARRPGDEVARNALAVEIATRF